MFSELTAFITKERHVVQGLWRIGFRLALRLLLLDRHMDRYRRAVPSRRMRYRSKSSSSDRVMSSDASAEAVEADEEDEAEVEGDVEVAGAASLAGLPAAAEGDGWGRASDRPPMRTASRSSLTKAWSSTL